MPSPTPVMTDLTEFRRSLRELRPAYNALLAPQPMRALFDIAFDVVVAFAAVASMWLSVWLLPAALLLIANRQRAIGNVLHDAAHHNLWRDERINDAFTRLIIAPLALVSISAYRDDHFKHHRMLGTVSGDPDYVAPTRHRGGWCWSYCGLVFQLTAWKSSCVGHLASGCVPWRSKACIVGWWFVFATSLAWFAGPRAAVLFVAMWLLARGTFFHLITTFREMCDHYGLRPGGIWSFTRDMTARGFWR